MAQSAQRTVGPEDGRDPVISIRNLHKTFKRRAGGGDVKPVDDVSLEVHQGELVVLLGPSGCGKTTLLRCVAGLERPDSGEIRLSGRRVYSSAEGIFVPPNGRALSMIFQSYALWPHMSVAANVAYPLKSQRRRMPRAEVRAEVERVLEITGLTGLGEQYPGQLSGGQQQRVALARALVARPDVILFDEPLSNVDARVREQLRVELLSMQRTLGFAALYVTHDQTEAMELGHRIAVLHDGVVEQLDTPKQVYGAPANLYVANFIGTTNTVEARLCRLDGQQAEVVTAVGGMTADAAGVSDAVRRSFGESGDAGCAVVFRPEAVALNGDRSETNRFEATVDAVLFLGSHIEYLLDAGGERVRAWTTRDANISEGDRVTFSVDSSALLVLPPGPAQ